jgi:hypothetical protein
MKPKTAEKSASTHPQRQDESTRERVLDAALYFVPRTRPARVLVVARTSTDAARDPRPIAESATSWLTNYAF